MSITNELAGGRPTVDYLHSNASIGHMSLEMRYDETRYLKKNMNTHDSIMRLPGLIMDGDTREDQVREGFLYFNTIYLMGLVKNLSVP